MGCYIHVAGINWGPYVLKHKYHRHWNHGRPRFGFGGILGVLSIEPLLGGVQPEGSIDPPPPRCDSWGMPCTQCARSAKFCMSVTTRTLVLALLRRFVVP